MSVTATHPAPIAPAKPTPGIYRGVPAEQYHAWPHASNSRLTDLLRSPAHCYERMVNPPEPTPAMILGTAAHYRILEPELFEQHYVVTEQCSEQTKGGKQCSKMGSVLRGERWYCTQHDPGISPEAWQAAHDELTAKNASIEDESESGSRYYKLPTGQIVRVADHAANARTAAWMHRSGVREIRVDGPPYSEVGTDPRTPLSPEDEERTECIASAVWFHKAARKLIEQASDRELSVVYDDADTGVRSQMRADFVTPAFGVCGDVKTTVDASASAFTRSIYQFGYHRQGDRYMTGMAAHGFDIEHFAILAAEKDPPFGVAVYRLDDRALRAGREQCKPLLERWAECVASGHWPAYPEQIQDITLPPYAWRQIEDSL